MTIEDAYREGWEDGAGFDGDFADDPEAIKTGAWLDSRAHEVERMHEEVAGAVSSEEETDYEKTFIDFWRDLVCNPDGRLNRDAVMRELSDYTMVMGIAREVYMHVTGGRISKANTLAVEIVSECDAREEQEAKDLRESIAKGLEAEAAKFADHSYADRCVRDKLLDVAKRVRSGEWG